MSALSFDDKFAMFDSTPVDNIFITTHMPQAPGDYVKVYLYGLFRCHHPQSDMTIETIAKDLDMEIEDVKKAYKYWERRHLVWRTSDNPLQYSYISPVQCLLAGSSVVDDDDDYTVFAQQLSGAISGSEWNNEKTIMRCYEWHTDEKMSLNVEVIAALIRHLTSDGAKKLPMKEAEKKATKLVDYSAKTAEDAENVLVLDDKRRSICKSLLVKLGQPRNPSEPELEMYRKWTEDWGFTPEAIEAALVNTVSGKPTFAYLDGILKGMWEKNISRRTATDITSYREASQEERSALRKVLKVFNESDTAINPDRLEIFRKMRALYTDDIILLAAKGCVRYSDKKSMEEALNTLDFWKKNGVKTLHDAQSSVDDTRRLYAIGKALNENAGIKSTPTKQTRQFVSEMEKKGFSDEMILHCAAYAAGTSNPMSYLRKLMEDNEEKKIFTPEQMDALKLPKKSTGKVVAEQKYTQRDYSGKGGIAQWVLDDDTDEEDENAQRDNT